MEINSKYGICIEGVWVILFFPFQQVFLTLGYCNKQLPGSIPPGPPSATAGATPQLSLLCWVGTKLC